MYKKKVRLSDIVARFIDYRGKTPGKTTSGTPLITAKIIKGGTLLPYTEFIAEDAYDEWMTRGIPNAGDVIMTTEAPLGEVAAMPPGKVALAQRVIVMQTHTAECHPSYLKYHLQWEGGKQAILNKRSGSTVFGIRSAELKKVVLHIHEDTAEQERIAHALSCLDAKIAHNNELIKLLEEQAQLVYDYWFMQFDFPDENGRPYRSSGGKMVWSDELQRNVPAGWEIGSLGDILRVNPTEKLSKGTAAAYIELGTIATDRYLTGAPVQRIYDGGGMRFRNLDVLLVRITPSLENGKTALVHDLADNEIGFGSTEYIVMRGLNFPMPAYCITLARSPKFRNYAISRMRGTSGRRRLDHKDVSAYVTTLPPESTMRDFEAICEPIIERLHIVTNENKDLAAQRDFLLPRLMTGEITVAE